MNVKRPIRSLASQYYLAYLMSITNAPSLYALQKILLVKGAVKAGKYKLDCSRCFYKTMKGSAIQSKAIIESIEQKIPGSQRILKHPLWLVLENSLDKTNDFQSIYTNLKKHTDDIPLIDKEISNRRHIRLICESNNHLDALTCLIMKLLESTFERNYHKYNEIKWGLVDVLRSMSYNKPMLPILTQLQWLIYALFIEPKYITPKKLPISEMILKYLAPPSQPLNLKHEYELNKRLLLSLNQLALQRNDKTQQQLLIFLSQHSKRELLLQELSNLKGPVKNIRLLLHQGLDELAKYVRLYLMDQRRIPDASQFWLL